MTILDLVALYLVTKPSHFLCCFIRLFSLKSDFPFFGPFPINTLFATPTPGSVRGKLSGVTPTIAPQAPWVSPSLDITLPIFYGVPN